MLVLIREAGEIGIKSPRTRARMEAVLINNIKKVLNVKKVEKDGGILIIDTEDDLNKLKKIFGVASFSPIIRLEFKNLEELITLSKEVFKDKVKGKKFAVRVRRVGNHSFTSLDVARLLGAELYPYSNGVDLKNPDIEVYIDIRDYKAYLYSEIIKGPKGLPVGTSGKTVVLFSGGFDSPVATWFMMKRGNLPIILNFILGGKLHKELVLKEVEVLREWSGGNTLTVFFIDGIRVQASLSKIEPRIRVVVLKRVMYRTAEILAKKFGIHSITTGESLSQVSSQTVWNLEATEYGISLPIFRPLIGFDKDEIISYAKIIGTYEISSRLPEYCVISTKSTTRAKIEEVIKGEESAGINYEELVDNAEVINI
jgi:thiamine biosynthesis protein ThiI